MWPDDLDAGPPIDALAHQVQHRDVVPPATFGPWEPIQADDNLTIGSRDSTAPEVRLEDGMDFDQVFPRILRAVGQPTGFTTHLNPLRLRSCHAWFAGWLPPARTPAPTNSTLWTSPTGSRSAAVTGRPKRRVRRPAPSGYHPAM